MEKREMEQIVEQVTRQVLSALGQGKSPDAQTEGLPKVLVVGGAGQDVPECYRRDVVLLDIEDYRTNRNILRYDRVLIAHLNITQLADIAQGRIGDEVSCAVVHALLNGIETLLLEDALAFSSELVSSPFMVIFCISLVAIIAALIFLTYRQLAHKNI